MKLSLRLLALLLSLFALVGALSSCNIPLPVLPSYDPEANLLEAQTHARPTTEVATVYEGGFYNQLTPNEKAIYDAVLANPPGTEINLTFPEPHFLACPVGSEPSAEDTKALGDAMNMELRNALIALWLDKPAYFWGAIGLAGEQFTYSKERTEHGNVLVTSIRFTAATEDHHADVTVEDIDALYEMARATPIAGKTVAEKVDSINRAICEMAEYSTESQNAHEAHGVFVDGKAVCEGFARAFQILCEVNGVECVCVFGDGVTSEGTEGHMWNYVKLDNGKWYAVDVTWNENTDSKLYLFCGLKTRVFGERFEDTHLPMGKISEYAREFVYPVPMQIEAEEYRSR